MTCSITLAMFNLATLCVCVCVCVDQSCNLLVVIPGYWVMTLLMPRHGSVGLVSQSVPCSSFTSDDQKLSAFKTKNTVCKSKSRGFLHTKSKIRLACWNVQSAGALNTQSLKLQMSLKP